MTSCRYCAPRRPSANRVDVAALSLATLYLNRDQRFRGYCVLVFDGRHANALEELTAAEYHAYMADLQQAARAIRAVFQPELMNYESLGNQTPHLHWHLIPRYPTDSRWGYPIWDGLPFEGRQVYLPEAELLALRDRLRAALAG